MSKNVLATGTKCQICTTSVIVRKAVRPRPLRLATKVDASDELTRSIYLGAFDARARTEPAAPCFQLRCQFSERREIILTSGATALT
jgi:hypothetical protein